MLRTGPNLMSGAVDEMGIPELRISTLSSDGRFYRVSAKGVVREIVASQSDNIDILGDGMLLSVPDNQNQSRYIGPNGNEIARFNFPPGVCHFIQGSVFGNCRLSADGRKFLIPLSQHSDENPAGHEDGIFTLTTGYALFEIPGLR